MKILCALAASYNIWKTLGYLVSFFKRGGIIDLLSHQSDHIRLEFIMFKIMKGKMCRTFWFN